MHTLMVLAGGFLLLGLFLLAGKLFRGSGAIADAAKYFIPLWLVAALTVAQETPILLIVFAIPAAVALFIWWRFSRG